MKSKLRIGILADSLSLPNWAHKMLARIANGNYADIVLFVLNDASEKEHGLLRKIIESPNYLLWELFLKYDQRKLQKIPNAFALKDYKINPSTNIIRANYFIEANGFRKKDIEAIQKSEIDVFVRLGFDNLKGMILNTAKYGVWSYHFGDREFIQDGPPGAWEVLNNIPETGVFLEILNDEEDHNVILAKSFSRTDKFSVSLNNNTNYWKALSLLPRKLEELYQKGDKEFFDIKYKYNEAQNYPKRRLGIPTNIQFFTRMLRKYLVLIKLKIIKTLYDDQWIIAFKPTDSNRIETSFIEYRRILPPRDRDWADPFIINRKNKYFIFFEEIIYKRPKGHICVLELDEKGNHSIPEVILKKNHHLSYPYLIEDGEDLYMIPETAESEQIQLYKCIVFPQKWEPVKVLMDNVVAVDTTVFKKDDKYWLFTNIRENEGANKDDELFLFYSNKLDSNDWKPHLKNPIVSDVKRARPAGNLFYFKDKLIRPSQNGSKHYGYGMQLNQITKLNETEYEEKILDSIYPDWGRMITATHTYNKLEDISVVDYRIKRRRF